MADGVSVGVQPQGPAAPWWGGSARPVVAIASVFPQECQSEEKFGPRGGFTKYVLPAAPRDGVSTLKVSDTGQLLMDWGARALRLAPIPALEVANSLVSKWSGFTLGSKWGRPGIWVCAEDEPSKEEIAREREVQEGFFRGLIQEATDWHTQGKLQDISDLHRRAAEWLLGSAATSLPWVPKVSFRELKICPACGEEIKASALSCRFCQVYLPEFYEKAKLSPQEDPVVRAALERARSERKPQPVVPPTKAA